MGVDNDNGENEGEENEPGESKKTKTLSQDEVDRLVGQARTEGRRSATQKLLSDLGIESTDELKQALAAAKEAQNKDLSEQERKAKEAEERAAKAEREASVTKGAALEARKVVALVEAGVPVKSAKRMAKLVDVDDVNASEEDFAAAVAAVKEDMPELFSGESKEEGDEKPPANKESNPGGAPAKKGKPTDKNLVARDVLARRHPNLATKKD